MKTAQLVCCTLLVALAATFILLGAKCTDSSDGGGSGDSAYCEISGSGLADVTFKDQYFSCSTDLGVTLAISKVRANAGLTVVEVQGQYAIDNNNTYYLRGQGIGGETCWDKLHNSGSFTVRMQSEECHAKRRIVLTTDIAASVVAFCQLSFAVDQDCPNGDDDTWVDDDTWTDDDIAPDDDTGDDDTWPDDDTGDDDTWPDDDTGDDDDTDHPPVLSNAGWDPSEVTLGDVGGEYYWYSALMWSVCDLGNDLLPDGGLYIYLSGTSEPFLVDQPIDWSDLNDPPDIDLGDVDDCGSPVEAGLMILFGEEASPPPAGDYCCDIEATDDHGYWSNKLEDLCVTMPAS